ncbi:MFS transporter [Egibacter rhizosphaerae]|uniref:MFS transporter n=1 Tax=Egibacter rhizosphaerae TaxID=1670831 RepID=A0A411YBJ1_9ACTN|nr:MFS transporter [Egibacter rhizosphaerae]QBI18569.1 MFS transporter [Egibacter rhizosphaerae]
MSTDTGGPVGPGRAVAAAIVVTTVGALPPFLLGGMAVQVRGELTFTEGQLGLAVTVFFAVSAALSAAAGRLTERLGIGKAMATTALFAGVGLLVIAASTSYGHVLAGLAVAAIGNAFAQPGANALLAHSVRQRRQGLVFGAKQSAVPFTSLLGGAAVPLIALTVGWRWAFVAAVGLCVTAVVLAPRDRSRARGPVRGEGGRRRSAAANRVLRALVLAALLGNMGANSLGIFLVESLVDDGVAESLAGALLVLSSSSAIAARVAGGWLVDRRGWHSLRPVGGLLAVSSLGYLGLAWLSGPVLAPFALLTFAAGWGWNGLFALALVRTFHREPAAASGVAQGGLFVGAMAGPGLFGWAVELFDFAWAWSGAGVLALSAGATMLLAQRLIERYAVDEASTEAPR